MAWNHARQIDNALGLSNSDFFMTWANLESREGKAQIDLLIDVTGGAVYLMELKCSDGPFVMIAGEAARLLQSRRVLSAQYLGKRSVIVCLLAVGGARTNTHLRDSTAMTIAPVGLCME